MHHDHDKLVDVAALVHEAVHKLNHKIDVLHHDVHLILKGIHHMSIELDNLTAQVKANSDAIDSAVTLINGIAARIDAAGVDPVKLKALSDELKSKDDVLAAAVVANTPAA